MNGFYLELLRSMSKQDC
ncbi:hypothetical protein RDI58_015149 [Solanum bulbocastanum]|uniref:Uncharacterized protein n=1 Tax=Solanum bulbocastanum TaxID=147425 RepID=A0AAN8YBA8_SOLBU